MTKVLYSGTSAVTMTVEVAFATANPITASPTWTDITAFVRQASIRRGRWDEKSLRCDAGTASVVLKNAARTFDPLYTAGPYFGQLVPMKQIRIRATYSAVTYDLFRGYVDEWPQGWDPVQFRYSETTITCTDAFGLLATFTLPDRYTIEVLADSPVGYWTCDDPGNELTDYTNNGNDGAWDGDTARNEGADPVVVSTRAARYLGVSTFQAPPDLTIQSIGNVTTNKGRSAGNNGTLEAWCLFTSSCAGIVDCGDLTVSPAIGWSYNTPVSGRLNITVSSRDTTNQKTVTTPVPLLQWVHIAVTYTFAGTVLTVYINGQPVTANAYDTSWYGQFLALTLGNFSVVAAENNDYFKVANVAIYSTALSAARILAHYQAGLLGGQLERSGARIQKVLDYVGWPAGLTALDEGDSWLDRGPAEGSGVLEHIYAVQETEQGRLFITGAGVLTFHSRTWDIKTAAANTSQATFGDSGSELRYTDLKLDGGHVERIINEVLVTPARGIAARKVDSTSQTNYGTRTESLSTLHPDQSGARNLASWRLNRFSAPTLNFTNMELHPRRDPANQFPQALGLELGSRITVTRRPQAVGTAITQDRIVEGVEHTITPGDWTTSFFLCTPTPNFTEGGWGRVGNATNGKIGTAKLPY